MSALLLALALLLGACAGDGPGNDDTVFRGFSGFVIAVVLVVVALHYLRKWCSSDGD